MSAHRLDPLDLHRNYWPETYDDLLLPFALALHRAHEVHRQTVEAVMMRHGLTPAEFDVLATLRRAPPPGRLTPSELQQAMFITSGGLTKVLQQLEARGLITRTTSDSDRRSKPVHLTRSAHGVIEPAMTDLIATLDDMIRARLRPPEVRNLTRLLGKLPARD